MLERRVEALDSGGIDWGQAESLAFASLLVEGISVRLTGQDTERGTFSHRHLVLHDAHTGAQHAPIKHLSEAHASFEAYNSPLSEYAALGFEYGYSVTAPEALVLWEAQFGDFVNGAQIVVDQFLVSGLPSGARPHGSRCCCRTATRATGPSTRARGSSASCSSRPRRTSASSTRPPRRSTSTCCAGRRSTRTHDRSS